MYDAESRRGIVAVGYTEEKNTLYCNLRGLLVFMYGARYEQWRFSGVYSWPEAEKSSCFGKL